MTPAAATLLLVFGTERSEGARAEPPAASGHPDIVVPAVHGLALMTVMRVTESLLWPDPFSRTQHFGAHYEEAFTKPPIFDASKPAFQWDGDRWWINGIGHALFGSELYLRARQCRFGWAGSFAFAAATSALWEYAFEGNGVRPSGLDLVYTPVAGAVFGELRHLVYELSPRKSPMRWVVDPFGEVERAVGTPC